MKDFIHRTIESDLVEVETEKDGKVAMTFTRTRNSLGYRAITAEVGSKKIKFSSEQFGDGYEQVALSFAKGLQDMAYQSCLLPTLEKDS